MSEQMKSPSSQREHPIHLLLLLRNVIRRLWCVVLVMIIAASCAFVASDVLYTPQYQTKTTFVVSMRNGATSVYSNLNAAQGLAASFSEVLSSNVMTRRVTETLGHSYSGSISASVISETNLLEMKVTSTSPREAYLITQAVLENYDELAGQILNNVSLDILQQPVVPTTPINSPNTNRYIKIAVMGSGVVTIGLICLWCLLRDTVKSVEEVEEKLDTKLLATLHYERKKKTLKAKLSRKRESILITNPTTGFSYVETIHMLRSRISRQMKHDGFKTIMVTSVLENEGKSTVCANLALSMARRGKRVLLIDADMRKPAIHKIFDLQARKYATLADLLRGNAEMNDALVRDVADNLLLLLGRHGTEHSTELASGEDMALMLRQVQRSVDVVIIDTPPMTVSADAECLANLADATVLVVRQDTASVPLINDMLDILAGCRAKVLGCVLNNYHAADIDDQFTYGSGGKYGYGHRYGYGYGYGKKYAKPSRDEEEEDVE